MGLWINPARLFFSYSKANALSIVLMAIIVCAIIMVIGNNIALSLGLVGSLSIIRFRTAIKDIRYMMYLFVAIVIGLSTGTGNWLIAIFTCIAFLVALTIFNFESIITSLKKTEYLLMVTVDKHIVPIELLKDFAVDLN